MSVMLSRPYQMIRTGTTMTPTIFSHPDRQPQKFRPFKAFQHFRKLIADKEDTEQVFHIFENLPRKGFMDDARAFVTSDFGRSEEHTSELQSLMRISYAVFCLKKKIQTKTIK